MGCIRMSFMMPDGEEAPSSTLAPAKAARSATMSSQSTRQPCHPSQLGNHVIPANSATMQSHFSTPLSNHLHANRHVISTACSMPSHHARGRPSHPTTVFVDKRRYTWRLGINESFI